MDQKQKTLSLLVLRMQAFAEQFPGTAADLLLGCLGSLKALQGEEEGWGARSHVQSFKRAELQKMEGRKLFEKMRPGRQEPPPKEEMESLKGKVK